MAPETSVEAQTGPEPSLAEQGRAALARHAWGEALEKLTAADAEGDLSPPDIDAYADAAWWNGRLEQAIELRERAYTAAMRAGQPEAAVMVAIKLAADNVYRSSDALSGAWLQRAERLLDGVDENPGHGWLAATKAFRAAVTGDLDLAMAESIKAEGIAARTGDRNLAAMAQSEHGFALIAGGNVAEGMPMIDEASLAAVGGELEPETAGGICCTNIGACTTLGEMGARRRMDRCPGPLVQARGHRRLSGHVPAVSVGDQGVPRPVAGGRGRGATGVGRAGRLHSRSGRHGAVPHR